MHIAEIFNFTVTESVIQSFYRAVKGDQKTDNFKIQLMFQKGVEPPGGKKGGKKDSAKDKGKGKKGAKGTKKNIFHFNKKNEKIQMIFFFQSFERKLPARVAKRRSSNRRSGNIFSKFNIRRAQAELQNCVTERILAEPKNENFLPISKFKKKIQKL